jgi:nitrite reductase/ring-hydroxylating ferredoxin subunit
MGEFVRIADIDDVKPGHGMVVEVNGKALAVFNVDGQFHVIDNTCVHRGGPLGEGELDANVVTGVCVNNPSANIQTYKVKVEGTDVKALLSSAV